MALRVVHGGLETRSRAELERIAAAADEVLECERLLAKSGDNIVGELLRGHGTFYEWDHYPNGDVYDSASHAQYFYHAHPQIQHTGEHGHFHTFLRPRGMPSGIVPAPVPKPAPTPGDNDALSHIIAIAMDKRGHAISLFTTNRWVTGETWYDARDVIRMLDRFAIDLARPSWPTNRWVSAMLQLFRLEIVALLEERDASVACWTEAHPEVEDVYEDRRLEITSRLDTTVTEQAAAVRKALART